ncbi:MAG TPA: tetratricopeptide repeat protein [Steroidobacteraceae bacterium]|nr:tetratricopeptide repeat protein [Steroidobacteraceae bacterium]
MRRLFWWPLPVLLMLAATAAVAQVPAGTGTPPASPAVLTPGVTIGGKSSHDERPLPKLPADEFSNCMRQGFGFQEPQGGLAISQYNMQAMMCEHQLDWETHVVLEDCLDRDGKTPLPRVVQACTESLDHNILAGKERFFLLANRAQAYFAHGDPRHALADYGAAIKLAPDNADLYYNRGVVLAAQSNDDAALRDFDTAVGINSKLVPALCQRAKIHAAEGNFSGALADYSAAIRLQPNAASLWSERGNVDLRNRGYEVAVKDEDQAIQLDPKLARAYYLRSVAFGNLGDRAHAVSDLQTAVGLDPSLAGYVIIKGKSVSIGLPPL